MKNKFKGDVRDTLAKSYRERQDAERRYEEAAMRCGHQTSSGKLKIKAQGRENGMFRCTLCETVFSVTPRPEKEVINAVFVLSDVINQTKCLCDPISDAEYIAQFGNILSALKVIPRVYTNLMHKHNSGEGKHRRNEFSGGGYGTGGYHYNK